MQTMKKLRKKFFILIFFLICFVTSTKITLASFEKDSWQGITENTLPINLNKRKVPLKWNGQERRMVYFTFDDGPSKNTQRILDILNEYDVKATFFMIGTNVAKRVEEVKAVSVNGHYIGLHSMSHDKNIIYNVNQPDALVEELVVLQDLLEPLIGSRPNLLRPPYGSNPGIKPPIANSLVERDFKVWDWTIDTLDWRQKSIEGIMQAIEKQNTKSVEVLLVHEKDITIQALPSIIQYFKDQGYEFRAYDPNQHFILNLIHDERL